VSWLRGAAAQVNCGGMQPTGMAEQQACCGTGECCWTPLRVEQGKIHREKRMKIRVETTRRRSANELLRNAAALAWQGRRPVAGRVNVA
jgi:hypothetical protein